MAKPKREHPDPLGLPGINERCYLTKNPLRPFLGWMHCKDLFLTGGTARARQAARLMLEASATLFHVNGKINWNG